MINILATTPGVENVEQIDSLTLANEIAEKSAAEATTSSMSIWELCFGGGIFSVVLMCLLIALLFVLVFIFVDRFIAIRKATTIDANFMNRIRDYISEGKIDAAIDLCRRTNSPIARMVEKGIERIGRPMGDIQTAIENVANVEVAKLETSLPWLSSIAGGAPMIGFLGTVVGMVQVFMNMSANQSGAIELSQLSEGMFVAMITTVGGLVVGIPAYFAYNYLVARIEKLVFRMEATTIAFMDILNQPVQK
jgi:biopolymer transport protein ExbB